MRKVPGFIALSAHHCVELLAGEPFDAKGADIFESAFAKAASMERFFEPLQDIAMTRTDARRFGNGHSHGDLDGAADDPAAILAAAHRVLAGFKPGQTPCEATLDAATRTTADEITTFFERKILGLETCPARYGSTGYGPCDATRDGWLRDNDVRAGLYEGHEAAVAASGQLPEPQLTDGLFTLQVSRRDLQPFNGEIGEQAVVRTLACLGDTAIHVDAAGRRHEGLDALLALEEGFGPATPYQPLSFPASAIDRLENEEIGYLVLALDVSTQRAAKATTPG